MTKEETEQLIADIRKLVEKNITRFMNQPPYITAIDGGFVTFALGEYSSHCCIATEWVDGSGRISRAITAKQIKELISNANKMLAFLESE